MVKPRAELQNQFSGSSEIFVETLCLPDFISMYKFVISSRRAQDSDQEEEEDLKGSSSFGNKRTKLCKIRYIRFNPDAARVEYFREMLLSCSMTKLTARY